MEAFAILLLVVALKGEYLYRIEKAGEKVKNKVTSVTKESWEKVCQLLAEDYKSITDEIERIFADCASALTLEELRHVIIPEKLFTLDMKDPESLQALQVLLNGRMSFNANIESFYATIEDIFNDYYKSQEIPSLKDYEKAVTQTFKSSRNLNKQAVGVMIVSLYQQRFSDALVRLANSNRPQEVLQYQKIKNSFSLFLKYVESSPTLNQGNWMQRAVLQDGDQKITYQELQQRSHEFIVKVDKFHQANLHRRATQAIKHNLFEWQQLTHSLIIRLFDKQGIQYVGTIHPDDLKRFKLRNLKLDGKNPITQMVAFYACLNRDGDDVPRTLSQFFLSRAAKEFPKTEFGVLSKSSLPELIQNSRLIAEDLAEVQEMVYKLLQEVDFLNACVLEFEQRKEQMGFQFLESGEHKQWLAIIDGVARSIFDRYQMFNQSNYVKEIDRKLNPHYTDSVKGKLALDNNQQKLVESSGSEKSLDSKHKYFHEVVELPTGPKIKAPIYHDRVGLRQSMADFGYWYQLIEDDVELTVEDYQLNVRKKAEYLNRTDLNLAVYFWNNPNLYAKIDKSFLKHDLINAVKGLDTVEEFLLELNTQKIKLNSCAVKELQAALGESWSKCLSILSVSKGILSFDLRGASNFHEVELCFSALFNLQKIKELGNNFVDIAEAGQKKIKEIQTCGRPREIELPKIIDKNSQEMWFHVVYAALYHGQGGLKRSCVNSKTSWHVIQKHAELNVQSRSAKAMEIVNTFLLNQVYGDEAMANVFKAVHQYAYRQSTFGFFRKTRLDALGDSITYENARALASKSGSRSQAIFTELEKGVQEYTKLRSAPGA